MLLSVKERTGEIGLRMAVGARPRDVLVQFLGEALALTLAGGAAGLALGALGTWAVALATALAGAGLGPRGARRARDRGRRRAGVRARAGPEGRTALADPGAGGGMSPRR